MKERVKQANDPLDKLAAQIHADPLLCAAIIGLLSAEFPDCQP